MPTEETELIPITRDIPTLLSLDTYQGMTDAEIDSLIAYKIQCALESDLNEEKKRAIKQSTDAQLDAYRRIEEASSNVLKSLLEQPIQLFSVSENGEVIQNV